MNLRDLLFKPAQLRAGETKMIDGRIALCINPSTNHGPLWAIKNRCAMFTLLGHSRYIEGLCRDVIPDKRLLTIEIIRGPYAIGTVLNVPIDEIGRFFIVEDEDDERLKKMLEECTTSGSAVSILETPSLIGMQEAREAERYANDEAALGELLGAGAYQWLKNVTGTFNEITAFVQNRPSRSLEKQPAQLLKKVKKLNLLLAQPPFQNQ